MRFLMIVLREWVGDFGTIMGFMTCMKSSGAVVWAFMVVRIEMAFLTLVTRPV